MRLQCPNCDAEYEVDSSAIPLDGRDVQCSNCGHGWFQSHPDYEIDFELESSLYDPPPPLPQGDDVAGAIPKHELDPEALRILREEVALEESKRAAEAAKSTPPASDTQDTRVDHGIDDVDPPLDVGETSQTTDFDTLQSDIGDIEAALDAQIGDGGGHDDAHGEDNSSGDAGSWVEAASQVDPSFDLAPDLPELPTTEGSMTRISPRRVARLKGLNAVTKAETDPLPPMAQPVAPTLAPAVVEDATIGGSGGANARNTAPDTDLRSEIGPVAVPKKSGRRAGFYSAVLAALGATASYIMAPDLAQQLPQIAPFLEKYVGGINSLRDQLQAFVPAALQYITSLLP